MYAELLAGLADDLEAGGPTTSALRGHEDDPGPSGLALRLAGSIHRLVLSGAADELAPRYPTTGGVWESGGVGSAPETAVAVSSKPQSLFPSVPLQARTFRLRLVLQPPAL